METHFGVSWKGEGVPPNPPLPPRGTDGESLALLGISSPGGNTTEEDLRAIAPYLPSPRAYNATRRDNNLCAFDAIAQQLPEGFDLGGFPAHAEGVRDYVLSRVDATPTQICVGGRTMDRVDLLAAAARDYNLWTQRVGLSNSSPSIAAVATSNGSVSLWSDALRHDQARLYLDHRRQRLDLWMDAAWLTMVSIVLDIDLQIVSTEEDATVYYLKVDAYEVEAGPPAGRLVVWLGFATACEHYVALLPANMEPTAAYRASMTKRRSAKPRGR